MDRLIKKAELLELVGASYPTIWRWMRDGAFPRSVILGPNRVAWRESEVREWLEGLARGGPKPTQDFIGYVEYKDEHDLAQMLRSLRNENDWDDLDDDVPDTDWFDDEEVLA